jgi:lysophospholipid acyltransferase (LPLAT)-like uncharacterized protein
MSWAVISLWSRSLKIRKVNRNIPVRLFAEGKNVIYAFWHDGVFLLPFTHRNSEAVIMVSESRDGEIAAGVLRRFGFTVVRGSSKRKGQRALIGLVSCVRQGRSVAIVVDGPRGPRHEAKKGAIFLAGKLQKPIIPVSTWSKRCWTLRTWDRFVIPVPFTEGVVQYGQPIVVNGTSKEEIESKRRELEAALLDLKLAAAAQTVASCKNERAVSPGKQERV